MPGGISAGGAKTGGIMSRGIMSGGDYALHSNSIDLQNIMIVGGN